MDPILWTVFDEDPSPPDRDRFMPSSVRFRKIQKIYRRLDKQFQHPFLGNDQFSGPELLNIRLSEITTRYPSVTLDLRLGNLGILEGKGSHKRTLYLLCYLAFLGEEYKFLIDLLLEKIVSRFFNRSTNNLGSAGLQCQQLLKVFGRSEVRQLYLKERYSNQKQLYTYIHLGERIARRLTIRYFSSTKIEIPEFKRGYRDHGSLKAEHQYHGEREFDPLTEEEVEKVMSERRDPAEILLEIYQRSTENYLEWLRERQIEEQSKKENKVSQQEGEDDHG